MCVESPVWLVTVGVLFVRNLTCDHAAMFIVRVTKTASRTDKLLTVLSHMFTHTYAPYWHGAEPTLARCMQCRALLRAAKSASVRARKLSKSISVYCRQGNVKGESLDFITPWASNAAICFFTSSSLGDSLRGTIATY